MDGSAAPRGWGASLDPEQQGVLVLDAQGRIQDANPEACRLLGLAREALVGTGWPGSRQEAPEDRASLSEEKYAKIFQASPDAVALNRLADGVCLEVNEGFSRITGFSAQEALGRSFLPDGLDLWVDIRDRERLLGVLGDAGQVQGLAARFRRKDRTVLNALVSASKIEIQGQSCVLSFVRDITDLRAQSAQLERMTRLYAALSQVNQAIVWSPTPAAMLDKICEAMVEFGKFSMAWIGLDDPETHEVKVVSQYGDRHGALAGLRVRSDDTELGRGGAGRAIRAERSCVVNDLLGSAALAPWHQTAARSGLAGCAAIPFRKGGRVCGALMVYASEKDYFGPQELGLLEEAAGDLTFGLEHHELEARRLQSEAELLEAKAVNEAVVNSTSDLIWSVDAERFDLLTFNQAMRDYFLYQRRIVLRVGMPQEELFPPGDFRTRWLELYRRALAEGGFTEEYVVSTSTRILKLNGNLLKRDGRVFGISVFGRDITEPRKAQEKILRMAGELEQRVRERTAQLEAANQELEAFSYSVSHDLRTPLMAIHGFSDILMEEYHGRLEAGARKCVERISASARRMGRIIEDLLNLSRLGRQEMHLDDGDISLVCEEILAGLAEAHPERRVEVAIRSGMMVRASHSLLKVALENLLGNAWKFTARQPHARIEVGETAGPGARTFFVRDNGAGFDMAHCEKLFKAFQRLHPASEYEGTGIGLATVQRIIQRHGGQVWAESAPGQGATFYFSIPEPHRPAEAAGSGGHGPHG